MVLPPTIPPFSAGPSLSLCLSFLFILCFTPYSLPILLLHFFFCNSFLDVLFSCSPSLCVVLSLIIIASLIPWPHFPSIPFLLLSFLSLLTFFSFSFLTCLDHSYFSSSLLVFCFSRVQINWLVLLNLAPSMHIPIDCHPPPF